MRLKNIFRCLGSEFFINVVQSQRKRTRDLLLLRWKPTMNTRFFATQFTHLMAFCVEQASASCVTTQCKGSAVFTFGPSCPWIRIPTYNISHDRHNIQPKSLGYPSTMRAYSGYTTVPGKAIIPLAVENNLFVPVVLELQHPDQVHATADVWHTRFLQSSAQTMSKMGLATEPRNDQCAVCLAIKSKLMPIKCLQPKFKDVSTKPGTHVAIDLIIPTKYRHVISSLIKSLLWS